MRRRFATLDVFTDRPFAGNPLAVVLDAEALDAAVMQAIAREFNHPETVFVFAPADPAHRARVRIFTPARELPFAGHPTVGTAVLLGARDGGRDLVLEEGIGAVRCTLESMRGGGGSARFTIPQLPTEVGPTADAAAIAAALSLVPEDIGEGLPARWSAGIPLTFVPIVSLAAIARCRPDLARFDAAFGAGAAVYVFCNETAEAGHHFHARMFAPAMGAGRSRDRLGRRRLCRRARSPPERRQPRDHDRAGLRDGPAESHPSHGRGRRRAPRFRFRRRRRRDRDRGDDRGVRAAIARGTCG
jgi:trans-2,3-dihydro-3-hydroxyanthranilate isomerase